MIRLFIETKMIFEIGKETFDLAIGSLDKSYWFTIMINDGGWEISCYSVDNHLNILANPDLYEDPLLVPDIVLVLYINKLKKSGYFNHTGIQEI